MNGVFLKTEDRGKTWRKVLYVDKKTGAADLAMDPSNPNRLLAAMWEHRRWPWFFTSGGPGSGLYVSTDEGESWRKLDSKNGLPKGILGRIGLAFYKSSPNTQWDKSDPTSSWGATFSIEDVQDVLARTYAGRVSTQVGVISVESPVRRKQEEMFDFAEMKKIAHLAQDQGIKMHLDGARLFLASAHTGLPPSEFARYFDTVYTSLYKCFNAASGAILAGPNEFIKDLYHVRRMFGGGLPQAWPIAAVALYYVDGFLEEYRKALKNAEKFFNLLQGHEAFKIETIQNGTNAFKFYVKGVDLNDFRLKLRKKKIFLPPPQKQWEEFLAKINVTWNRIPAEELVRSFIDAL
jgi:hypothetical protein